MTFNEILASDSPPSGFEMQVPCICHEIYAARENVQLITIYACANVRRPVKKALRSANILVLRSANSQAERHYV